MFFIDLIRNESHFVFPHRKLPPSQTTFCMSTSDTPTRKHNIRRKSPRNWFNIKFFNKICCPGKKWTANEKKKEVKRELLGQLKIISICGAHKSWRENFGTGSRMWGEMRKRLSFRPTTNKGYQQQFKQHQHRKQQQAEQQQQGRQDNGHEIRKTGWECQCRQRIRTQVNIFSFSCI